MLHNILMTPRQTAILSYHHDIALFATTTQNPVLVVLDLEDSVGLQIASVFPGDCGEQRDRIRECGAYPALTLTMTLADANRLLSLGWPGSRRINKVHDNMSCVILVSEERCLTVLLPR